MKKVAFITRHAVTNYGSALQAYATQRAIEKLGHEAVCINYIREDELPKNIVKTKLYLSSCNGNPLKRFIYTAIQKPVFALSDGKFRKYMEKFVKLTDVEYHTEEELKNNLPKADIYMTGSDQVWNTITYDKIDPAYFLSFVPDDKKKVAYAGSFGGKTVKSEDKDNIATWLKSYDTVTVRELSGVEIAESMGVEATQVLDPTFLLTPNDWSALIPDKKPKEKYVLVYQLQPNKNFEKYAVEFAKRKNLKLYRVYPYISHAVKPGKLIFCPEITEFMWYIKNAEYFLTDSFHGTSFAIGFNTQFIDILPNKNSERNRSILRIAGLEDRILDDYNDFSLADKMIDFNDVNRRIDSERERSFEELRKMLED